MALNKDKTVLCIGLILYNTVPMYILDSWNYEGALLLLFHACILGS